MLTSDLYNYCDAYFVVRGRRTFEGDNDVKTRNKKLIFKNNAHLDHAHQKSMIYS